MSIKKFFHHFFLPGETNNHRPKLLHYQSLVFFILFFLVGQLVLVKAKTDFSSVLGAATDISVEKLLELTNTQRQNKNLPLLVLNEQLSKAAFLKGSYMLEKNYWAHNAPDGTAPWKFVKDANYNYVYAGENLARGFTNSDDIITAWMASPTHRDNIFSPNYQDIGFAVLEGELVGENTTLVVEMFGSKELSIPAEASKQVASEKSTSFALQHLAVRSTPLIDTTSVSWYIGVGTISLFIVIFVLDMILIERRNIIRFVGHNADHIAFLSLVLLFIILVNRGAIL